MGEIWKDIDGYSGDYKISNLGRVKSFKINKTDGILLIPYCTTKYNVTSFILNKKERHFLIHRLVAKYFIPNPNNFKYINFIDGDVNNCRYDNLEWTDSHISHKTHEPHKLINQYNLDGKLIKTWPSYRIAAKELGILSLNIRKCLENEHNILAGNCMWRYATSNDDITPYYIELYERGRKVNQYDLNGQFIKTWINAAEAFKKLKISDICRCCSGKNKIVGNFQWRYYNENEPIINIGAVQLKNGSKRSVNQYTKDGKYVSTFKTLTEAGNILKIRKDGISACCKGKAKTCGGYLWRYLDSVNFQEDITIVPKIKKERPKYIKLSERKINQLDAEKNIVKVWENIGAILTELEYRKYSLLTYMKNKLLYKGFYWEYVK